jgi:5'-nucleotidase (lipoprotein e(P4) family)
MKRGLLILIGVSALALGVWIGNRTAPAPSLDWTRSAGEYPALCRSVYRAAGDSLTALIHAPSLPWAVVMDIDETCLSTADYRTARRRSWFPGSAPSFSSWCSRAVASPVAGAAEFAREVRRKGGRIILISDRPEAVRAPTEENLQREGIEYDALLLKSGGETKSQRRRKVEEGNAVNGLGPLAVVLILGDRLEDFPEGAAESGGWGRRYFLLPNPMYGSGHK